jgi:hypothetical protein
MTAVGRLDPFAPRLPPRPTSDPGRAAPDADRMELDDSADALKLADIEDAVVDQQNDRPTKTSDSLPARPTDSISGAQRRTRIEGEFAGSGDVAVGPRM